MRRVIFYLFYDATGTVDDFVLHKLAALREHAEHIFVVSNSRLDTVATARLTSVSDSLLVRRNTGYDVYAYRDALDAFGVERLLEHDELILMNCTFFGPLGSFDPAFVEAESRTDVDFWGVSEHEAVEPHPYMAADRLEAHIQSHWIGVRRSMFSSSTWAAYWSEMPEITSYVDSVNLHEARFTHYFHQAGYRSFVLYPASDYPSPHPLIENAVDVVRAGCPIVKRRSFFSDPLYVDRRAIDTVALASLVEERGFPTEMLLSNLARTSEPRVLATNLALLDVLPAVELPATDDRVLRLAAVVHVDTLDLLPELLDRLAHLPPSTRLVVTAPVGLEQEVGLRFAERGMDAEVRAVDGRGGEVSALLVDCLDLIEGDDVDLLLRVHTGVRSRKGDPNRQDMYRQHLLGCLLASPAHVLNLVDLFRQHSSLGMVMPPAMHMGQTLHGHAWKKLRPAAEREARKRGIQVPFDSYTPYAPYGTMFVARPAALRAFARRPLTMDDFDTDARPRGAVLTRVLERILAYASLSEGYHVRQVTSSAAAATDYSFLEYKYQSLGSQLPDAYTERQMRFISKNRHLANRYRRLWRRRSLEAIERGVQRLPWLSTGNSREPQR